MDEPDVRLGESGEWVTHLQERLHGLSFYEGVIDGHYGETTDDAVRKLHEAAGSDHDSTVSTQTWQSLAEQEQRAGISQDHGTADSSAAEIQPGQLSEDGQWQWDGTGWQAVAQEAGTGDSGEAGVLSEDGQWRWDGTEWVAVGDAPAAEAQQGTATPDGEAPAEQEEHTIAINEAIDDPTTEEAALL